MTSSRTRDAPPSLLAVTVLGSVGVLLGLAQVSWWPAELLILLATLVVPGWLVVDRLEMADPVARLVLTVTIGATLVAAGALVMVFTGFWHPLAFGRIVLLAAVVLLVARLAAGRRPPAAESGDAPPRTAPLSTTPPRTTPVLRTPGAR